MKAVHECRTETCRLLLTPLRGQADELLWMKEEQNGCTALHLAAVSKSSECVDLLLDAVSAERKYDFVAEKNNYGDTAIASAALNGRNEWIESLLHSFSSQQKGSLLKIQNIYLDTTLHHAACKWETSALKAMLESVSLSTVYSLLTIKNKFKRTPLEDAECAGLKESSELLMKWQLKSVVEALAVAEETITDLRIADEQKTKVLALADQTITDLKMADKQKSKALAETRQHIIRLQDESERRLSLIQKEARQQKADMAAMQQRMKQFTMYLQAPGDTSSTGNQYHAPDS